MPGVTHQTSYHSQSAMSPTSKMHSPWHTTITTTITHNATPAPAQQGQQQQTKLRMSTSSISSIPNLPDLHHQSQTQTQPSAQSWSFLHSLLLQDEEETTGRGSDLVFAQNKSKRDLPAAGSTTAFRKTFKPHMPPSQEAVTNTEQHKHGGTVGLSSRSVPNLGSRDPVNQWTSCRALQDPNDEDQDSDEDNDDAEDFARHSQTVRSETRSPDVQRLSETPRTPCAETRSLSRSTSITSNVSRRKRPLLLPPIMLPPIYTVKPTPLILRDDVYFAGAGARGRRPISDDEWEDLKGCRYLRIRPIKRPLKI